MSSPRNPEEIVLSLLRKELKDPSLSLSSALEHPVAKLLLDTVKQAFGGPAPPESDSTDRTPGLLRFRDSPAVIRAAILDSFALNELNPSQDERDALLATSDIITINGERRLRLRDEDRATFLAGARGRTLYNEILGRTRTDNERREGLARDPVRWPSAWLQRFLTGDVAGLDSAPPWDLKAALEGRKCLRFVNELPSGVPPWLT